MGFIREHIIKPATRSPHWSSVRTAHLKTAGTCEACGSDKSLEVHHKQPFHDKPELELDPSNLITLCDGSINCHLLVGHLGDWKSFNVDVVADAATWKAKIQNRPKPTPETEETPDDVTP